MESSLSKIVLVLMAIVVMAAGGFTAWYFLQHFSAQPQTQTNSAPLIYTPGSASTDTPGTSALAQTTTPVATPNLANAYATLFSELGATEAAFVTVDSKTTGNVANIYALYTKDAVLENELYPTTPFVIDIAAIDLNDDGTAEALVSENSPAFCGVGGCEFDIYQDKNNKWVKLFSAVAGGEVGVSSKSTSGYADLYLSLSNGQDNFVQRYTWNGSTYQSQQIVASWDGTTFNLIK